MNVTDMLFQANDWTWFILAAVLMLVELVLPGLFMIWIAAAAFVMGVFMLLLPVTLSWQIQWLIFALLCAAVIFLSRRFLDNDNDKTHNHSLNKRGQRLVGTILTVDTVSSADRGKARIGDSFWTISGNDLVKGAEMQVVDIEGNVLVVEPVEA